MPDNEIILSAQENIHKSHPNVPIINNWDDAEILCA